MLNVLCDLFWIVVSAILFLMLIALIGVGFVELSRQIANDRKTMKEEITFPSVSRWQMEEAFCNARKTDEMIRQYRRNRYTGRR